MSPNGKPDRGSVVMNGEECKGCGLCVEACPPKLLSLSKSLNRYGYHPAIYLGHGCSGCGHLLLCLSRTGRHSRAQEDGMKPELDKRERSHCEGRHPGGMPRLLWLSHYPGERNRRGGRALFPQVGGVFMQAESETASVNMLYGGAAAGVR